jgi:hypothetical protein
MLDHADFSPAEESIDRLRRSGWRWGEARLNCGSGRVAYVVYGRNGENLILVPAVTQREAWWRAVEQAAACGMLADWPRPDEGRG